MAEDTTTIEIRRETAEALKELFPGMTYEAAIQRLTMAPRQSYTIPLRKTVSALQIDSDENLVPLDGIITQVTMHFAPGANGLVDVRLLYYRGKEKDFIIPSVEDRYITLDAATPAFHINFPVRKSSRLKAEFLNYDGSYEHSISVIATILSTTT